MQSLGDGHYAISDEIDIEGEGASHFIFGRGWLLEIVELSSGEYSFYSDGSDIAPKSKRFGAFYPPFTVMRSAVKNLKGRVCGIGSVKPFAELPQTPIIFETEYRGLFTDVSQAFEVLKTCGNRQSIEVNTKPSLLSLKTKRLIDENYLAYPSMSRIAKRLGVSPEHLSRQFKRDYLLSPSAYLHQLRVSEATFRLSLGEQIIEICSDVGYNDLSRFYKQFRKVTRTSPANCRSMLKR
jgi:AraC-like DNA-binding protein